MTDSRPEEILVAHSRDAMGVLFQPGPSLIQEEAVVELVTTGNRMELPPKQRGAGYHIRLQEVEGVRKRGGN